MEYVNKQTGEVYQAEEVDLKNLCDGDLNFLFTGEFRKLINELDIGEKGNITINIKARQAKTWMLLVMKQYLLKRSLALNILKLLFQIIMQKKLLKMVGLFKR